MQPERNTQQSRQPSDRVYQPVRRSEEIAKKDHRLAQALRPTRARAVPVVPVRVRGCEQGYLRGSRLPSRRSSEAQSEALAGASASSPSREKPASWSISSIVSAARSAELSAAMSSRALRPASWSWETC